MSQKIEFESDVFGRTAKNHDMILSGGHFYNNLELRVSLVLFVASVSLVLLVATVSFNGIDHRHTV